MAKIFPTTLISIFILIGLTAPALSQAKKDTASINQDPYAQMLAYSRPGKFHNLFADLVGTWTFSGSRFEWVDSVTSKVAMKLAGSLVRRPFADGRFFIAELTTAAKIDLPVKDGKTINDYAKGIQTEGYDNIKREFQLSYINNHIGSDIVFWHGSYDSTTRSISYYSKMENVPGMKLNIRFDFVFKDSNHYQWNYFIEQNGKYIKDSEMNFTRVKTSAK